MEELRMKTEYQPANDPLGFPQAIAQKIVNRFLGGDEIFEFVAVCHLPFPSPI
jgi:hypothetical protein